MRSYCDNYREELAWTYVYLFFLVAMTIEAVFDPFGLEAVRNPYRSCDFGEVVVEGHRAFGKSFVARQFVCRPAPKQ